MRTLICGPETAKVSLRLIPSKRDGAGVLLRPDSRQAGGAFGAGIEETPDESARHPRLDRAVGERVAAEEVVLAVRNGGVVGVGSGAESELERVVALAVLHGEAVLQPLPCVAADEVGHAAGRVAEEDRHDLEVRVLVVRRKDRVRLRGALELFDLDQRLVAHRATRRRRRRSGGPWSPPRSGTCGRPRDWHCARWRGPRCPPSAVRPSSSRDPPDGRTPAR